MCSFQFTGLGPVHIAAKNGYEEVVQILLDTGVDSNISDNVIIKMRNI